MTWEKLPVANTIVIEYTDQLLRHIMDTQEIFGGNVFFGIRDF